MNCRQKAMKRSPSMPEWVSKAECKKCKKKGHLSFDCPPKYDNKPLKHNNEQRYSKLINRESANVCEFAGMTNSYDPPSWTYSGFSAHVYNPNKRNNQIHTIQGINSIQTTHSPKICYGKHRKYKRDTNTHKIKSKPYSPKRNMKHKQSVMYSYNYHKMAL